MPWRPLGGDRDRGSVPHKHESGLASASSVTVGAVRSWYSLVAPHSLRSPLCLRARVSLRWPRRINCYPGDGVGGRLAQELDGIFAVTNGMPSLQVACANLAQWLQLLHAGAWLLGFWLADGEAGRAVIKQINEDCHGLQKGTRPCRRRRPHRRHRATHRRDALASLDSDACRHY